MKFRYNYSRPTREQLGGLSPSEFKTFLIRNGFRSKEMRHFWKFWVFSKGKNLFRIRGWGEHTRCFIDVCNDKHDFDRWANSTDRVYHMREFYESYSN